MKYLGISVVGLALAAGVATAFGLSLYSGSARVMWPQQSASLNLPTVKQRQELAQLRNDLEMLHQQPPRDTLAQQSASLFPTKPVEPIAAPAKNEGLAAPVVKAARVLPSVSVILRSGFQGTAVIDSRVAQVGDSVPGGYVVKAIEANRVVFLDTSKREHVVELAVNRMASIAAFPDSEERP